MTRHLRTAVIVAGCLSILGVAQAQPTSADRIRAELMTGRLDDAAALPGKPKTRQLQVIHRVGLTVSFKPGSSALAPEGEMQLDELARALQSPELLPRAYLITGHTDRHGNPKKNQRLSEQRAEVVRGYLLARFELAPGRLQVAGVGDAQPLPRLSPYSAANRRVEITEIGHADGGSAAALATVDGGDRSTQAVTNAAAETPAAR